MAPTVDYRYYSQVYGGQASEEAFEEAIRPACDHVRWFCHGAEPCGKRLRELYKRALCACVDAFAEHGDGAGFSLGDFTWRPTRANGRGGSGADAASRACVEILGCTPLAFAGVR